MDSGISGQFRMKGKTDLMLILYGDDMIIHGAEHLDGLFDRSDIRGTDKYHRKGGNLSEICCGAKAAKLSAIGITFDSNRQGSRWAGSPVSISSERRIRPALIPDDEHTISQQCNIRTVPSKNTKYRKSSHILLPHDISTMDSSYILRKTKKK
jgi:hypothetical protein